MPPSPAPRPAPLQSILLAHVVPDVEAFAADAEDGAELPTAGGAVLKVKNDGKTITIVR